MARTRTVALVGGAALALSGAALANRYPFVFDDTGAYLASGLDLRVPGDRPIHYGLLLRALLPVGSAWVVVGVQALAIASLVHAAFARVARAEDPAVATLLACGALALLTGVGVHVGYLIPDVWAAAGLLSLAVLVSAAELSRVARLALAATCTAAATFHLSHLPTLTLVLGAVAAWQMLSARSGATALARGRLAWAAGAVAAGWLLLPGVHALFGGAFRFARGSPAFAAGRLVENGIMGEVLAARCAERGWKLCAYRDRLPQQAWQFVWEKSSPFYATGSWSRDNMKELAEIVRASWSSPRLVARQLQRGIEGGASQLFAVDAGTWLTPMTSEEPVLGRIRRAWPLDVNAFLSSDQSQGRIDRKLHNALQRVAIGLSVLLLAAALLGRRRTLELDGASRGFAALLCVGVVANAFVCGGLAGSVDRYQSRVAWLLPLAVLVLTVRARRVERRPPEGGGTPA